MIQVKCKNFSHVTLKINFDTIFMLEFVGLNCLIYSLENH